MEGTKGKIEKAAISLFNSRGYENVSLREIASAAGTTIGNLTYHFPRKRDLLESIISAPLEEYWALLDTSLKGDELLERLVVLFVEGERMAEAYSFFFKPGVSVRVGRKASESLTGSDLSKDLLGFFTWGLQRLRKDGYISPKLSDWSLGVMASTITTVESSWVLDARADHTKNARPVKMADALCGILLPAIADEHRDAFERMCREHGVKY